MPATTATEGTIQQGRQSGTKAGTSAGTPAGTRTGKERISRYTKDQIIDALRASGGIQLVAAQKLGCARSMVTYYKQHVPGVAEALEEINESLLDLAEGVVAFHVRKRNLRAAQFVLETKGKARGWVKRGEITGPGGAPVDIRLGYDLSQLSADDLAQIDDILERAEVRATEAGASSANGKPQ